MTDQSPGEPAVGPTNGTVKALRERAAEAPAGLGDAQTLDDCEQTLGDGDQTASDSDQTAAARDAIADARDARAAARDEAAADRDKAARDREQAARDRLQAQSDRDALLHQLALAETDPLTGARTRGAGLIDVDHEIDRARRISGVLTMAFVDVATWSHG